MDGVRELRNPIFLSRPHDHFELLELLRHVGHVVGPNLVPQNGKQLIHVTAGTVPVLVIFPNLGVAVQGGKRW
ncbi:hypothetical protein ACFX11_046793 [Malus domestica]